MISPALRILLLVLVTLLATFPAYGEWLLGDKAEFFLQQLSTTMIYAIFAMSLDLMVGMTGLISLGHALFFGFAGYMLALIAPEYAAANFWTSLPLTLLACAGLAAIIGALVVRTSGVYFLMATLAFAEMLHYFFNDADFAGGSDGMYIYFTPEAALFGWTPFNLDNKLHFFYVTLVLMLGVYWLLRMIVRSPFGHVILGIHANEHRTQALGYHVNRFKLSSFVIASTLAGLAGYLAAAQFGFINPSSLGWHTSGTVLIMVILGGMGTLFGPALGAFAFELLHYWFESLTEHWLLLMGAMVIAVVMLLPNGIASLLMRITATKTTKDKRLAVDHKDE